MKRCSKINNMKDNKSPTVDQSITINHNQSITKCIPHIENQVQHIHSINVGKGKVIVI